MKTMAGKYLVIMLTLAMLFNACAAFGEHYAWDCPECGRTGNTGQYCGNCAHPAPWTDNTPEVTPEPMPVGILINRYGLTTANVIFWMGPGTDYDRYGELSKEKYVYLIYTEENKAGELWTLVKADGQTGYLKSDFLRFLTEEESDAWNRAQASPAPVYYSKPDQTLTTSVPTLMPEQTPEILSVSSGEYITFGQYEQDNNLGNGSEPIDWLVLDVQEDNALLISKYGLDAVPYNEKQTDTTWEKCTLRAWLNDEFLNKAFSEPEQSSILSTTVDNSAGQCYSEWRSKGGNNTQDKIFLLSYAEANRYFDVTDDKDGELKARTAPTAYAIARGGWKSGKDKTADGAAAAMWWLRSPGSRQRRAAYVRSTGALSNDNAYDEDHVVRPVLWVDLNKMY